MNTYSSFACGTRNTAIVNKPKLDWRPSSESMIETSQDETGGGGRQHFNTITYFGDYISTEAIEFPLPYQQAG